VGALFNLRVYALNAGTTGYDWNENTITWNTSPAVSSNTATFYLDQSLPAPITQVGSFDVANSTPVGTQFNVAFSNWSSFVQADNSLTLIVVVTNQSNGTPSLTFASSESLTPGTQPLLTIPEPGSAMLTAIASLAVIGRRRR
jgi:hypothetical protein